MADFAAKLSAWARQSENRMKAIVQESAQRVFERAQTPIDQGGNLPVDTGFLRASFAVSYSGMPTGPSENPGGQAFSYDGSAVSVALASFTPGGTVYAGWTAEYAIYMEARYAFMRRAAQNWPAIVREVTKELKAKMQ